MAYSLPIFFLAANREYADWLKDIVFKPARKLSLVVTFVPSGNARPDQIVDLIKELCNLNCFFTLQGIYDKSIALYNLVSVALFYCLIAGH